MRVPVDTRLTARPLRPARRHAGSPFLPIVDDILTIYGGHYEQDDNRPKWITTEIAHCKVLQAGRGPLGTLDPPDALAEGHQTVEEFELTWVERHEGPWLDRQVAYLVEQGIPQHEADETRDAWAKVRYDHHWASREVWLLEIEAFHDMPLLLVGLPDEPEAIPLERIHQRWTTKAARRYEEARREEERVREAKQLGRRLRSAKLRSPDAPEINEIKAALMRLEARYSQAA
jgi:hypothetical protein